MKIPDNAVPDGFSLIAIYFFLSPGASNRRVLSDEGAAEVQATSQFHLGIEDETISPKIQFLAAFHGEQPQTRDAVLAALRAINHPPIDVARRGAFEIGPLTSSGDVAGRARDILRLGMVAMLGGYQGRKAAGAMVPTFLVGYPAPNIAYAVSNPDDVGTVGSADIVAIYVSHGPDGAHRFHGVRLSCPIRD